MSASIPTPRVGVSDAALTRPDWGSQPARDADAIWLDRNENIDPALAQITQRVLQGLDAQALYTYPDLGDLYRKLAGVFGGQANQYVLAAGSDGAIRTVFEAYISPGDIVMHSHPTFAMYPVYSRMYAADARPFSYDATDQGPVLNVDKLIGDIKQVRPRLVCLPNPDSPTGTAVERAALKAIVDAAGDVGAVMLIDEAYYPFYPHTVADWVNDNPHLVVTRSFGKAWGLAGVRVGFAVAHPDMAVNLHKVRPMYEIGALSASMLEAMLDHADDVTQSVARVLAGKAWFVAQMRDMGYQVLQTHGNFQHVAFGADEQAISNALKDRVLYRRDFPNTALAGYSRFSVAPQSILEPVVDLIRTAVPRK
ncbi:MAG TPA: histidinol-phosphate transaminase [Magnetovibrio sp.]